MNAIYLGQYEHNNYTLVSTKKAVPRPLLTVAVAMAVCMAVDELWFGLFVVRKLQWLRLTKLQIVQHD